MSMEKQIQVGVAWADIIVTKLVNAMPTIFVILVSMLILAACVYVNMHNDKY